MGFEELKLPETCVLSIAAFLAGVKAGAGDKQNNYRKRDLVPKFIFPR